MAQAADAAVADRDQEALAGDRRVAQHVESHHLQRHIRQIERRQFRRHALNVAVHLRRLAQQHVHRHVDGEQRRRLVRCHRLIGQHQLLRLGRHADHRVRAALAHAHRIEHRQQLGLHREHIALLAFVAPDLLGRQAAFLQRHLAQVEASAPPRPIDQFGERVRDAAGADIVDRQDRVHVTERRAVVDDLLRAPLDLRVAALHRVEIERRRVGAGGHRTGRAAAHADAHAGPAQLDQQGAGRERDLVGLRRRDRAQTAGDHDGLVITAPLLVSRDADRLLVDAEVARQVRPAEFVVERSAAERPFDHDLQRAGDVLGLAVRRALPRPVGAGQVQVRHGEAGQARLRLRAAAGRAFVADLAAGASRRAGKRRDRGRVVVRLDLHQHMRQLIAGGVARRVGVAVGHPALDDAAGHHRRVVAVRDHGVLWRQLMCVADHLEHRALLRHAIDRETGVEDLVAAMLAVGLREHHQLDVGRVAAQRGERAHQVVDLVVGQGQAEIDVGRHQRRATRTQQVDVGHRRRRPLIEQVGGVFSAQQHAFGHAIVKRCRSGPQFFVTERLAATKQSGLQRQPEFGDALDAPDCQTAVVSDVGGFGRPGRDRSQAWCDDDQRPFIRAAISVAVAQQSLDGVALRPVERGVAPDPVHVAGMDGGDASAPAGGIPLQFRQQRLGAKGRERTAPFDVEQVLGRSDHARRSG